VTSAKVIDAAADMLMQKLLDGSSVTEREIGNVKEVAHTGAVFGLPVATEHPQLRQPTNSNLGNNYKN
jgi:hypothetical protein